MTQRKVKKAVFPVGGLGTRFLPATKAIPKEMLPVNSKPLIQYAFEEARNAGIEQFIFITGRNKNALSNHFDHSYELQSILTENDKHQELSMTKDWLPQAGNIAFIRQQEPLGLGHAIWCAHNFIGDEPFAVLLADEMLQCKEGFLKEMVEAYEKTEANIIALAEIDLEKSDRYGIISPGVFDGNLVEIKDMVEKPHRDVAPSNLSITGRYILNYEIFEYLKKQKKGKSGEIQLTDAMQSMLACDNKQKFYGLRFDGPRFDCGNKKGFLEANIAYALLEDEDNIQIKNMLKKYI